MFVVVSFPNENDALALVCDKWLKVIDNEHYCHWPDNINDRAKEKAVREQVDPILSWPLHKCTVRADKIECFEHALRKMKRAEETSDLSTCDEEVARQKRRVKCKRRLHSDDEDEYDSVISKRAAIPSAPCIPPPQPSDVFHVASPRHQPSLIFSHRHDSPSPRALLPQSHFASPNHVSQPYTLRQANSTSSSSSLPVPIASTSSTSSEESLLPSGPFSNEQWQILMAWQKTSIELQQKQAQKLEELSRMVRLLQPHSGDSDRDLLADLDLPIKSNDELIGLERRMEDASFRKQLSALLSSIGGGNPAECTRRVLSMLLSSDFAVEFSFKGRGDKRNFSSLKIWPVVIASVRRVIGQVTDKEVEEATQKWLKYASDRNGGRDKRRQSTSQE